MLTQIWERTSDFSDGRINFSDDKTEKNYSEFFRALFSSLFGNGKRHHTPIPLRLRKIKRISFKAFLHLKELFKNFRHVAAKPKKDSKFLSHKAPAINDLKTRIHLTRDFVSKNEPAIVTRNDTPLYEPTQMSAAINSSFWQWRRVVEWDRYINDPYENIRGT